MEVTGPMSSASAPLREQVSKIASSPLLSNSDALCRLLNFLAAEAIDNPGIPIKEYRIATELFRRPAEFDPKQDSTVRVQTARLRSKLSEYYSTEGSTDDWLIEIPKGAYLLTCRPRPTVETKPEPAVAGPGDLAAVSQAKSALPGRTPRRNTLGLALLSACLAIALGLVLDQYFRDKQDFAETLHATGLEPADLTLLKHFWKPFLQQNGEPLVVFSNAEFIGRPETGMRYLGPGDPREAILDHYTGVGEVAAIHSLDQIFAALHKPLRVKRGRLLALDDAQTQDLIFVGSPSENLTLRDVTVTQDFAFQIVQVEGRHGDLAIVNLHPTKDEQERYFSGPSLPVTTDYALISLIDPGASRYDKILLAGTTTFGTQAAVEFVCDPRHVRELLTRVSGSARSDIVPFEAVLKVKVSKGVPVQSEIVALRRH